MHVCFYFFEVRPKVELQTLLQQAGAEKDVFTMKEVSLRINFSSSDTNANQLGLFFSL